MTQVSYFAVNPNSEMITAEECVQQAFPISGGGAGHTDRQFAWSRETLRALGEWLILLSESDDNAMPMLQGAIPAALFANFQPPEKSDSAFSILKMAEEEFAERRLRERHLDPSLLGEPGWDVMLDLLINLLKGKDISVTSACIGSGVPLTTALRWIESLIDQGLVQRMPDNLDKRRSWLTLTVAGKQALRNYFREKASLRNRNANYI